VFALQWSNGSVAQAMLSRSELSCGNTTHKYICLFLQMVDTMAIPSIKIKINLSFLKIFVVVWLWETQTPSHLL
jgi:hypothetical protein